MFEEDTVLRFKKKHHQNPLNIHHVQQIHLPIPKPRTWPHGPNLLAGGLQGLPWGPKAPRAFSGDVLHWSLTEMGWWGLGRGFGIVWILILTDFVWKLFVDGFWMSQDGCSNILCGSWRLLARRLEQNNLGLKLKEDNIYVVSFMKLKTSKKQPSGYYSHIRSSAWGIQLWIINSPESAWQVPNGQSI